MQISDYMEKMLEMYKKKQTLVPVAAPPVTDNAPVLDADGKGGLVAIVTTVRGLYPVPDARVTVFTGNIEQMQVVDRSTTDQSGKSKLFSLDAPQKSLSLTSGQTATPYASYNMLVEADGFVRNIHLNIPVFSGVTSLQGSDMLLIETAGEDKSGQVFDEREQYDL